MPLISTRPIGFAVLLFLLSNSAGAEPLHTAIDRLIAEGTPNYAEKSAPIADDAEFLRRIHLDLIGRIPSAEETRAFLADVEPAKRSRVVDELLASPEHERHLAQLLDLQLMQRRKASKVKAEEWESFLVESVRANKPWDVLVRDVLSADGSEKEDRGPARFYLDRNGDVNTITRDVSALFLGADITCAQCHDHPEVSDYTIADYYGLSAFFVRSFVFTEPKTKQAVYAEKAEGEVTFKSVFVPDAKDASTPPHLPGSDPIVDPTFEKGKEYEVKPAKNVRPIPAYSRREQLPERLATAENERFRRAAANRFWALMLGRGIVDPIDADHSDNPPSHPELLDLLAREFAAHEFDIRWLLREIALSETYQRSSRLPEHVTEPLPESAFARARLKPLTPEQFARSMLEATGFATATRSTIESEVRKELESKNPSPDEGAVARELERRVHAKLKGAETRFVAVFGQPAGESAPPFEATVEQAMFLMNDNAVLSGLKPIADNLFGRLAEMPEDDPETVAAELYLSILGRPPSEEEVGEVRDYLGNSTGEVRMNELRQLAWALLTSAEFRFVH